MSSSSSSPSIETVIIRGMDCRLHVWKQEKDSSSKASVVLYHGFLAHSKYPTVLYAAELLHQEGYTIYAADLPGHGQSPGMRGYLPSAEHTIQDGITIAEHVIAQSGAGEAAAQGKNGNKIFLLGSSLGGCIALNVAKKLDQKEPTKNYIAGVVLLAPMLAINVSSPARSLLKGLSYIIPTLAVIPSSASDSSKQYRDPQKLKACEEAAGDSSGGMLRIASASACVEMASQIQESKFKDVHLPFLCMVADEDVVVDSQGSLQLFDQAPSKDKTIKRYKALHGLLCETEPLISQIKNDLLSWINERT